MVRARLERVSLTCSVSFAQKDLENNRGERYLSVRLALDLGIHLVLRETQWPW